MIQKYNAKIIKKEFLCDDVINFHFQLDKEISFKAGQFVNLKYNNEDENIIRAYSIASSPNENEKIELTIKKVENGKLTPILFEQEINSQVELMGGFGLFNIDKIKSNKIILIGTGTGIAPLRSIIKYLLEEKKDLEITLVFGNRYENEILFKEEFEKIEKENPNFKYIYSISRPKEEYIGRKGYVQEHLINLDIINSDIFICGLINMINDVKQKLLELGANPDKIHFEKFD